MIKETNSFYGIHLWSLLAGILFVGLHTWYQADRYYLGEKLSMVRVVVDEVPKLNESRKGALDRWSLKGKEQRCSFWLSGGALDIMLHNKDVERQVEEIAQGDVLLIMIRASEETYLQEKDRIIRVLDLSGVHKEIISAADVETRERRSFYIYSGIPVVLLLLWIVVQVRKYFRGTEDLPELTLEEPVREL